MLISKRVEKLQNVETSQLLGENGHLLRNRGMQTTALTTFVPLLDVVHIRFPRIQLFLRNDFTPRIALQTMETKDHSRLCEVLDCTDSDIGLGDSHDPFLPKTDQTFEFCDLTFKNNWT